jgi:hypothetical protein
VRAAADDHELEASPRTEEDATLHMLNVLRVRPWSSGAPSKAVRKGAAKEVTRAPPFAFVQRGIGTR